MIIVRLQGGLGNQLFQYAAGKALATHLNKPFKLETITSLRKDKRRSIALNDLQATFDLASRDEVKEFVYFPSLYRHPSRLLKIGRNIYREPHFQFDENFFNITDPVFIDGFWQSPLYFKNIESIIRRDVIPRSELINHIKEKGTQLSAVDSIAVHVRRGDFLNEKIAAYHGILNALYFEKAIKLVKEKVGGARVYFFSDDINWVKENVAVDKDAELVSATSRSAIEDFYLMTKCRHNIIANSSFSWWPAWLNTNPDKIVVAPKNWFADTKIDTSNLIPPDWLRI